MPSVVTAAQPPALESLSAEIESNAEAPLSKTLTKIPAYVRLTQVIPETFQLPPRTDTRATP